MKPSMLVHLQQVDSTNEYVKQHAHELPDGAAVLADRQTAGRGRMGRNWQTPSGEAMLCSWLYHQLSPRQRSLLPQAAGLAAVQALSQLCAQQASLKWPNDLVVWHEGRYYKLGGILCESRCTGTQMMAVCGIGVNLCQSFEALQEAGLPDAASVQSVWKISVDRLELVERLTEALQSCIEQIEQEPELFLQRYSQSCMTLGKQVTIQAAGQPERCAVAVRIGEDGCLICREKDKEFSVYAGDVSIRSAGGYA